MTDATRPPKSLGQTDDMRAPPLLRRMACWLYEVLLVAAVLFATTLVFIIIAALLQLGTIHAGVQHGCMFLVLSGYFIWQWSLGQTLPMKTWRIRVVSADFRRLTLLHALRRYLWSWLWVLPPLLLMHVLSDSQPWSLPQYGLVLSGLMLVWIVLWAALSYLHPQRQFWHDALAGTRLVETAIAPPSTPTQTHA